MVYRLGIAETSFIFPMRDELKSYSLIQESSRTKAGSMLTGEACTLFPSLRTEGKELLTDPEFVPFGTKASGLCVKGVSESF
ncbi:hypothetical protein Tco_0042073 [Tanacetum coccineum]